MLIQESIGTLKSSVDRKTLSYDGAIDCLIKLLREDYPDYDIEQKILLTGAIRARLVDGGAEAIRSFRLQDDLEIIRRLSQDAIGDDAALRVNATIILASVVDNSTICVPIDALYSLRGKYDETSDNGRFNMVGVIGTVAPWSYQENFAEITRALSEVSTELEGQKQYARTLALVDQVTRRTNSSAVGAENRHEPAPSGLDNCKTYEFKYRQ